MPRFPPLQIRHFIYFKEEEEDVTEMSAGKRRRKFDLERKFSSFLRDLGNWVCVFFHFAGKCVVLAVLKWEVFYDAEKGRSSS